MSPSIRLMLRFLVFSMLTVAICYANSVSNPFLQDDLLIVSGNQEIRQIAPLHFLSSPYSQDQRFAGTYRPLTILSFSVDYSLWGNTELVDDLAARIIGHCRDSVSLPTPKSHFGIPRDPGAARMLTAIAFVSSIFTALLVDGPLFVVFMEAATIATRPLRPVSMRTGL